MSTLVEDLRDRIWRDLQAGVFRPGAPLDERALTERFSVSRTPVREALSQLLGLGVIGTGPRGGFAVPRLRMRELRELLEFLGELESSCAKLAARRIGAEALKELCAAHLRCAEAAERRDSEAYEVANEEFHRLIHTAACNPYITNQLSLIKKRCAVYWGSRFSQSGRVEKSLAAHAVILDRIRAGDDDGAYAAMAAHVAGGGAGFAELVATMPAYLQEE